MAVARVYNYVMGYILGLLQFSLESRLFVSDVHTLVRSRYTALVLA